MIQSHLPLAASYFGHIFCSILCCKWIITPRMGPKQTGVELLLLKEKTLVEGVELLAGPGMMARSGRMVMISKMLIFGALLIILVHTKPSGAAVALNNETSNCTFPFDHYDPDIDQNECRPAMSEMFACLTYLLGAAPLPSANCCAGVVDSWEHYPVCLCRLTYYPPGNITRSVRESLTPLCNVSADLCTPCPKLLGLLGRRKQKSAHNVPLVAVVFVCLAAVLALVAAGFFVWRKRLRANKLPQTNTDVRDEIMKIEGKPTVFPYNVLKAATRSFDVSSKLGEGGFGVVYKGVLPDGSEVAVKQLSKKSSQGGDEFLNEVTLITGVQHRNLVKLRGCCFKGDERLLVYEFLENRSLHHALFAAGMNLKLDWPTRVKILMGTARGLAYLHEGCQTKIVHRDIKSSNILLDRDLNPKIADFGLARLFTDNQSHVSTRVAGTWGYVAPEYAMRGQLTEKADVFSFGIVALELVSGRHHSNICLPPEQEYLLDWVWKLHDEGNPMTVLDPVLRARPYPEDEVMRVVEIALLCTQSMASMRPPMSRVVSMLAGDSEVETTNIMKPCDMHMFSSRNYTTSSSNDVENTAHCNYTPNATYPSGDGKMMSSNNNHSNISIVNPR